MACFCVCSLAFAKRFAASFRRSTRSVRWALACALAALVVAVAGCGGNETAKSRSATRVDEDLARALRATLEKQRALHNLPGVSAAVALPDGTLWSGASGEADRRTGRPLHSQTPMAIASVTKTFIAALILKLAEAGPLEPR